MVDIEAETACGTCTYVDKSCIRRHHVSKDFCTTVINEVCSGSQERKFGGRTRAQKNFSYCLLLQTGTIIAMYCNSHHYSNHLLQDRLEDRLLHFFAYGCSLAC